MPLRDMTLFLCYYFNKESFFCVIYNLYGRYIFFYIFLISFPALKIKRHAVVAVHKTGFEKQILWQLPDKGLLTKGVCVIKAHAPLLLQLPLLMVDG